MKKTNLIAGDELKKLFWEVYKLWHKLGLIEVGHFVSMSRVYMYINNTYVNKLSTYKSGAYNSKVRTA